MTTSSTPKTLASLKYQDFVFETKPGEAPETIARKAFKEIFDSTTEPTLRLLFKEDGKKVYESYIDSGSVDYIYIIAR